MYCLRCATRLTQRTFDSRPRWACPACGWVLYEQIKVGAAVLVERDGMVLLARRSPGDDAFPHTWNLPAGYCEPGESPAATAAREAEEETGLRVQTGALFDALFFDDDPRGNGVLLVYEARPIGGRLWEAGLLPQEVAALGYFPPDSLPHPLCGAGHDRAIRAWQRRALDRWQPGMPMRYCPHCTHPLRERAASGRVRPACDRCGYVQFRDPKMGVSVWVEEESRVLLVLRGMDPGKGRWALPSGFVEWDEAPEAAARRECLEEAGLLLGQMELVQAQYYTGDPRGPGVNLVYRASPSGGALTPGDDAVVARFFSRSELPPTTQIAFEGHARILAEWQAAVDPGAS